MIFIFTLFTFMLRDEFFCLLKELLFISSLFANKNPFNFWFWGVVVMLEGGVLYFRRPEGRGYQ